MQRRLRFAIPFAIVVVAAYWWLRRPATPAEEAYVSERTATAWSRLAQVREPVVVLKYGDRVAVVDRKAEHVLVRAAQGETGWVDARALMPPELWRRAADLRGQVRTMPMQARAHTRVLTNVRAQPGRAAPRIFQFGRDAPVEILSRAVAEASPLEGPAPAPSKDLSQDSSGPRREDWLLVRARDEQVGEIAGWVLGRFLELVYPDPLRDLGAGIRFVAWFELDRVLSAEGEKPQYLAVGVIGPEGQPCDFTLLRVYTWHSQRRGYETAYVESHFCARLPVRVEPAPKDRTSEAVFRFTASARGKEESREYRMRQNLVRRIRATPAGGSRSSPASVPRPDRKNTG